MRVKIAILGLAAVAAISVLSWRAHANLTREHQAAVSSQLSGMKFAAYQPQKVIYHITTDGGMFDRSYFKTLGSVRNHLDAVGEDKIDLRVIMQADGIGLLEDASTNPELAAAIDKLRAKGARFIVCRNSLVGAGVAPRALYGLKESDIVQAAVAEIAALQSQGFVYLRM